MDLGQSSLSNNLRSPNYDGVTNHWQYLSQYGIVFSEKRTSVLSECLSLWSIKSKSTIFKCSDLLNGIVDFPQTWSVYSQSIIEESVKWAVSSHASKSRTKPTKLELYSLRKIISDRCIFNSWSQSHNYLFGIVDRRPYKYNECCHNLILVNCRTYNNYF